MQCKIISGSNFDICYALTIRFVMIDMYLMSTKVQGRKMCKNLKISLYITILLLFPLESQLHLQLTMVTDPVSKTLCLESAK